MADTRKPTFDINDPVLQEIIKQAVDARMAAEKAAAQAERKPLAPAKPTLPSSRHSKPKATRMLLLFQRGRNSCRTAGMLQCSLFAASRERYSKSIAALGGFDAIPD